MEYTRNSTAAFSGHRGFKIGEDDPAAIAQKVREALKRLYAAGYRTFMCGMAEGFDLICGNETLRLRDELPGVRLVAVIPYPGQAAGFDRQAGQLYEHILNLADEAVTISPVYDSRCFHRRNDFMLNNSSYLVCYYNGSAGGTRYCFEKASRMGLDVENVCGAVSVCRKLL